MSLMGVSRADAEAHIQAQGGRVSRSRTGSKESLLAAQLAADNRHSLAYDGARQQWLVYNQGIWTPLDTLAPDESALQRIHREVTRLRPDGFSAHFLRGVERLLRLEAV